MEYVYESSTFLLRRPPEQRTQKTHIHFSPEVEHGRLGLSLANSSSDSYAAVQVDIPPKKRCDNPENVLRFAPAPGLRTAYLHPAYELVRKFRLPAHQSQFVVRGLPRNARFDFELKITCDDHFDRYIGSIETGHGGESERNLFMAENSAPKSSVTLGGG